MADNETVPAQMIFAEPPEEFVILAARVQHGIDRHRHRYGIEETLEESPAKNEYLQDARIFVRALLPIMNQAIIGNSPTILNIARKPELLFDLAESGDYAEGYRDGAGRTQEVIAEQLVQSYPWLPEMIEADDAHNAEESAK